MAEEFEGMTGEQAMESAMNGANEQETAEPAAEEVTDDTDDTKDGTDKETDGTESTDSGENDGANPKNEKNAAFAAARRKAEAEANLRIEAEQRKMAETIKSLGLTLPDGKAVENADQLKEYQRTMAQQKFDALSRRSGLTSEELNDIVSQHPDVIAAKEQAEALRAEQEKAQKAALKNQLDADIAEIGKLNPAIKSFDDLRTLDKYAQIYDRVKRGDTVAEAYKLCYMDDIINNRTRSAQQGYRNSISGKAHIVNTSAGGGTAREPSHDEWVMMREMFPGKSDSQLRKEWDQFNR